MSVRMCIIYYVLLLKYYPTIIFHQHLVKEAYGVYIAADLEPPHEWLLRLVIRLPANFQSFKKYYATQSNFISINVLFLELFTYISSHCLICFKVNTLSWPLSYAMFLDNFQCPFYNMFHTQITCMFYYN